MGETNDRGFRLLELAVSDSLYILTRHQTNDRVFRLLELAVTDSFCSLIRHRAEQLGTRRMGRDMTKIAVILTPCHFKSSIDRAKTRTYLGAGVGYNHDLVLLTVKIKLNKNKTYTDTPIKFYLWKLKNPPSVKIYQAQLTCRI